MQLQFTKPPPVVRKSISVPRDLFAASAVLAQEFPSYSAYVAALIERHRDGSLRLARKRKGAA